MANPPCYVPDSFIFQWHITERCNLRCAHCYQESYQGKELTLAQLQQIYGQFQQLLRFWHRHNSASGDNYRRLHGHINITGGEPLLRPEFWDLLESFHADRHLSFAILTNGTLIDRAVAERLLQLQPAFIQVSIEGSAATHERIRGAGTFADAVAAIRHLVKVGIKVVLSFTAHRLNFHEFGDVALLGYRLGVSRVWADRLIPCGAGTHMQDLVLTPAETRTFFELMCAVRTKISRHWFHKTEVGMLRALQFLVGGGYPYHCTAGDTLLAVDANGDLYPCRRMPIKLGNLLESSLGDLYYQHQLLRQLRDKERRSERCVGCLYVSVCRGGLRCLAYAMTGDPFSGDPGCWKRRGT